MPPFLFAAPYLAILPLAGSALAMLEDPPAGTSPFDRYSVAPLLEGLPPGQVFHRSAAGRLDGNFDPDIVHLTTDAAIISLDVGAMASVHVLERVAKDVAILPSDPGKRGLLALAGAAGISILEIGQNVADQELVIHSEHLFSDSGLEGLDRILAVDLTGNGELDLIGVGGPGASFARLVRDSQAPGGFAVTVVTGAFPGQVLDLALADILATGQPQAFIATTLGLGCFDLFGNLISGIPASTPRASLAPIRFSSASYLAWIRAMPSGSDTLTLLRSYGPALEFDLGENEITRATAGHFNESGFPDLLVNVGARHELRVYPNFGPAYGYFDLENVLVLDLVDEASQGPQTSVSQPIFLDLDMDGYAEIALGVSSTLESLMLGLGGAPLGALSGKAPTPLYMDFEVAGEIEYQFSIGWPEPYNRASFRLFHQGPVDGDVPPRDPTPFHVALVAKDPEPFPCYEVNLPLHPGEPGMTDDNSITWIEARFLQVAGSQRVLAAGPALVLAIAYEHNFAAVEFLKSLVPEQDPTWILSPAYFGNGEKVIPSPPPTTGPPPIPPPEGGEGGEGGGG